MKLYLSKMSSAQHSDQPEVLEGHGTFLLLTAEMDTDSAGKTNIDSNNLPVTFSR